MNKFNKIAKINKISSFGMLKIRPNTSFYAINQFNISSKYHTTTSMKDKSLKIIKHSDRASGSEKLERSTSNERPISPHVTIFKFPIPAISSITNRFASIGLVGG